MKKHIAPLAGLLILRAAFVFAADVPWPMKKGTSWLYTATIKGDWQNEGVNRHEQTTLRVVEHGWVGRFEIARLEGGPYAVSCSPANEEPTTYYWIRDRNLLYEVHERADNSRISLAKVFTDERTVKEKLEPETPIVEWPLHGRPSIGCVDSYMHCWTVEETKGEFVLTFRTLPDHAIVHFKPGIGITRWIYSHHGSPCDIDVKLVRFRR